MSAVIQTPGTRLAYRTLAGWVRCGWELDRRRSSSLKGIQIANHFDALPLELIKQSDDETALRAVPDVCEALRLIPLRGHRRGTKWELVNMAVKNRLAQLERVRDQESINAGDNWRRAHA